MKAYTCNDYRQEMVLIGLRRRLTDPALTPPEKKELEAQIRKLETDMGMN
jgi:hypothetical protein